MTTTPTSPAASLQAAVDAALLVLKSMGLSVEDLTAAPSNRKPAPTFAEYVPVVAATVTPGTLRAYRPYWKRTVERLQAAGLLLRPPAPQYRVRYRVLRTQRHDPGTSSRCAAPTRSPRPKPPSSPANHIRQKAEPCIMRQNGANWLVDHVVTSSIVAPRTRTIARTVKRHGSTTAIFSMFRTVATEISAPAASCSWVMPLCSRSARNRAASRSACSV